MEVFGIYQRFCYANSKPNLYICYFDILLSLDEILNKKFFNIFLITGLLQNFEFKILGLFHVFCKGN